MPRKTPAKKEPRSVQAPPRIRNKRAFSERLRMFLDLESGELDPEMLPKGFEMWVEENLTLADQMNLVQIRKALEGDAKAYELIMDRAHGKPKQKVEQETRSTVNIAPIQWLEDTNDVSGHITDGQDAQDAEVIDNDEDEDE